MSANPMHHHYVFDLLGGRLAIDFVNTVSGKRLLAPIERLNEYADLVSWGEQVKALSPADAKVLRRIARQSPERAAAALRQAKALRETLFRIFAAVAAGKKPEDADMDAFNRRVGEAFGNLRVASHGARFETSFGEPASLDFVVFAVVRSAVDVLTHDDLARVRMCEATDGCGWLFYDDTRNRQRRWCSMKDCGNRAKARRHYAKTKGDGPV